MEIKNLEFSFKTNKVINDISFKIEKGKITTIIGANGCGKSTLFNLITKNLKAQKGEIFLEGENIKNISLKNFAKKVAIVHQYNTAPADITVEALVGYGRLVHKSFCKGYNEEDEKLIEKALKTTGTYSYKNKTISELSGGQKQRVWIAMALAQNTKYLLLDEPTTYLDIKYQIEILRLIKCLNKEFDITVIMVLHDINQAIYYSDNIIAMKEGKIIGAGKPYDVITRDLILKTYGIELNIEEMNNNKYVIPI